MLVFVRIFYKIGLPVGITMMYDFFTFEEEPKTPFFSTRKPLLVNFIKHGKGLNLTWWHSLHFACIFKDVIW